MAVAFTSDKLFKIRILTGVILLSLGSLSAIAQPYLSRLSRFQVDEKKGCAPFTVTVTNLMPGTCIPGLSPCAIDYGDGTPLQTNPPLPIMHTYTTVGSYKLTVIYQSLAVQKDDITITADNNVAPSYEIWACAGNKASIKVTDNNYDQYVIDYNNDNIPETVIPFSSNMLAPSYLYAPPGAYNTSVRGRRLNSADNCMTLVQPFTTRLTLPAPTITTLTSIDNTSLKLDFTTTGNIEYRLEIAVNNSTTFQLLQGLYGISTITLNNLKLDENFYCFRLGAYDPCLNGSTYSNVVCTSLFTATAVSDVNQLVWTTGATASVTNYAITRNANNYVSVGSVNFNDTDVICKTNYCYQITTNYAGGGKSISLEKCVTAFSNMVPTSIDDVSSTVGGGVSLEWVQDPLFVPVMYSIFRSTSNTPLSLFQNTTSSPFLDNTYTTDLKACYQIKYIDQCDNYSNPGLLTCPLRLTGQLSTDNVVTLQWNGYKGWAGGVNNYLLQKFGLTGALLRSVVVNDTTFVDDVADPNNQYVKYVVTANPQLPGIKVSISNTAEFIKNANLYYPTAFTPNGDNLNDAFVVTGQYIDKMNMQIFDRWGALIYAASKKDQKWDGSRDSKPMPASTYVWRAEITDLAGRTFSQEGIVALIRN